MRGWSIPLGRWAGVEMRMHLFFPLLLFVLIGISGSSHWNRGVALFLFLVSAVATREIARLMTAAWFGLRLRAVLLLPFGSLFAYANPESQELSTKGASQFALAFAGPFANGATALMLAAAVRGASGGVQLASLPLLSPEYLLRTVVWMQALL